MDKLKVRLLSGALIGWALVDLYVAAFPFQPDAIVWAITGVSCWAAGVVGFSLSR